MAGLVTGMVIGLGFLMLVLAGVFHPKATEEPSADLRAAAGLPQAEVRLVKRPRYETAVGTIRAVHESGVASRLLARVLEVKVKAGQAVTRDEVLARLDDTDLRARVKQAEASVASAQAARDRSESELQRARRLYSTRAISREEYDRAVVAQQTAAADLTRAEQGLQETKALLDYATIRAPITGTVVDKRVEAGDTVTPGQVLVTLYDAGRMQMLATVRESLARRLKVGQKIPGRIETLEHECQATVSEIVPEVQAGSRSFTVKVVGPCPPGVYSGMFGRISIPLGDEQVVVVPHAAVFRVGQLDVVEVVVDDHVHRRSVQLGRRFDEGHEVLAGLKPGEKVVLRPAHGSKEATP